MIEEINFQLPIVYLKPEELYFGRKPAIVKTVLGSCLSIAMFNARTRIGAICHAVLPYYAEGRSSDFYSRYVDSSIIFLLKQYAKHNIDKSEIDIKIFGGSDMFKISGCINNESVGRQNILAAIETIKSQNLQVTASDVGGCMGRKVIFESNSGKVLMKMINRINDDMEGCDCKAKTLKNFNLI